ARVEAALRRDYAIHFHTVERWACLEDPLEDAYAVTPMVRAVYASCTPALVCAALAGDAAGVAAALAEAPDQGELDDALLAAAAHADAATVRLLLTAGADPATREEDRRTPVMAAVGRDAPDTIAALLAAGCAIDAIDDMGWTALHRAVMNDDPAAVAALLAAGASVTIRDDNGYEPLMTASESGRLAALELLLARGARVGATSNSGEDALAIARRHVGHPNSDPERLRILARLKKAVANDQSA
ncbi:ankyrin repeat domain-containing protein, partial [Nannocystis sp. SCPEA4]|uniref:ankyrin repeat domain-containing protein n=1 Tax=Nannocystis sp. SCPEA4 TaxID=2996787 RepID=UPI00226DA5F7